MCMNIHTLVIYFIVNIIIANCLQKRNVSSDISGFLTHLLICSAFTNHVLVSRDWRCLGETHITT